MGLRIFCVDESEPPPRRIVLELTCDGDHGLFEPMTQRFDQGGYTAQRSAAHQAGWREYGGWSFLGPCCSKKGGNECGG